MRIPDHVLTGSLRFINLSGNAGKNEWYVQAIAQQPEEIQISLFPAFVEVADELALGWEEALAELPRVQTRLLPSQLQAIQKLDAYMGSLSGEQNARVWTLEQWDGRPHP